MLVDDVRPHLAQRLGLVDERHERARLPLGARRRDVYICTHERRRHFGGVDELIRPPTREVPTRPAVVLERAVRDAVKASVTDVLKGKAEGDEGATPLGDRPFVLGQLTGLAGGELLDELGVDDVADGDRHDAAACARGDVFVDADHTSTLRPKDPRKRGHGWPILTRFRPPPVALPGDVRGDPWADSERDAPSGALAPRARSAGSRYIHAARCSRGTYQPRSRHSGSDGRSAPNVVSAPWPG